MTLYKTLLVLVWFMTSVTVVNASLFETVFKTPEHYYNIQYWYSWSIEDVKKWTTDNSYFLTLNLKDYSDENLYELYLLNYELEWEIRKMLSFLGNIQIDKVQDSFEDQMLKTCNTLYKSEKWYLPNEEQFIDYFTEKKPEILSLLYIELLRTSRELWYPINKKSWNWNWKWEEPFYMKGKKPYDLYLENRTLSDYYYDYKIYFHAAILVLIWIFIIFLIKIISKSRKYKNIQSDTGTTDDWEQKWNNAWVSFSKWDKIVIYILALIVPPLCIWLLSIPFFEEPIIIKNPWVDSVFFFGLIKSFYTKRYNHIITTWLVVMLFWHLMINILFFS